MRFRTQEKPHACAVCGKAFIAQHTLKRHMKVHDKVKAEQLHDGSSSALAAVADLHESKTGLGFM